MLNFFSKKKPFLIILGASGGVARATLQLLPKYRKIFSSLVLLDKSNSVIHDAYINHKELEYKYIQREFTDENIYTILKGLVKRDERGIVLDMTDCPTLPIISAVDSLGLDYMNCSLNLPDGRTLFNFVEDMHNFAERFKNGVHVLSLGMNPGIVNHLIMRGVNEHGVPKEVVEIEYESAFPHIDSGKPYITWSKVQFLTEVIRWNSGHCNSQGVYVETEKNALNTQVDTKKYLEPIKKLDQYPIGMTVAHDEIIAMCRILEVPGKFIYAIHPKSFTRLQGLVGTGRQVSEKDVVFEDNTTVPLDGSDCIGVWLIYDEQSVCYHSDVKHSSVKGTNATLFMVAVGVIAGLIDSIENPLEHKGAYSVLDLNNENILRIVSEYMEVKKNIVKSNNL
jgi:homospermidine synthase